MSAYYELVALAGFTHARPDYALDSIEIDGAPFRSTSAGSCGRRSASCFAFRSRRRGRSQDPSDRAHVGPFRHAPARHDPHAAARPPGVHHRLDQSAQRQARGRPLLARGLYPAYHRLRALHRRGLPSRCGLSADGLGACGDGGHGARPQRPPAGEPHADGGPDRRARLADQGQRTRAGKADRVVQIEHDRRPCRPSSRGAGGASIRDSFSFAPS